MTESENNVQNNAEKNAKPWHRSVAGRTFIAVAAAHALIDLTGGVWPLFKNLAQLDVFYAGLITTVSTSVGMSLQPLFGYFADRGHRRLLLLTGVVLVCAMVLLGPIEMCKDRLGNVGLYVALFAVMLTVRLGQSMFHPPGTSLAGNASAARRSTLVAVFISAGMVGFAISWFVFNYVYKTFDRNTLWLLVVFVPWVAWIICWCRPADPRETDRPSPLMVLRELAHMGPSFFKLYFIQACMSAAHVGLFFLLPEFIEQRGYPTGFKEGGGLFCFIFGSVLLMVPIGHLADRLGRRGMLRWMILASLMSFSALVWVEQVPLVVFAGMLMLTGGCIGATNPLGVTLAQQLAPKHESLISGVMMGLAWALGSLSPTVVGYIVKEAPQIGVIGALRWLSITIGAALLLAMALPRLEAHRA